MNEYCKDVLRHSWGTGPVRKALEKFYNANYYQENKNRWVVNREKRKAKRAQQPVSVNTSEQTVADIVNPLVPNIFESNARMEQVMDQQIKTSSDTIKKVINTGRAATKKVLKTIGEIFTTAFSPKNNKEIATIISDTKELLRDAFKFKF